MDPPTWKDALVGFLIFLAISAALFAVVAVYIGLEALMK